MFWNLLRSNDSCKSLIGQQSVRYLLVSIGFNYLKLSTQRDQVHSIKAVSMNCQVKVQRPSTLKRWNSRFPFTKTSHLGHQKGKGSGFPNHQTAGVMFEAEVPLGFLHLRGCWRWGHHSMNVGSKKQLLESGEIKYTKNIPWTKRNEHLNEIDGKRTSSSESSVNLLVWSMFVHHSMNPSES